MKHRRTSRFRAAFEDLPRTVQEKAIKAFGLFRENRGHPSLQIEQIQGAGGIWSGRIEDHYRWTFHYVRDPETDEIVCVHRVIGKHDEVYQNP